MFIVMYGLGTFIIIYCMYFLIKSFQNNDNIYAHAYYYLFAEVSKEIG